MSKVKQNFTTNAHKVAGTYEYRPDLCNIYFKDDHLYVTNAHVALKQHLKHHNIIDWQHLNGKAIHYQIFAFIKNRFITVTAKEDHFECFDKYNNKATFPYTSSTMDIAEMIENAIPKDPVKEISQIGLNHHVLNNLCKGLLIRDGALKMKFFGSNKGILITCPAYEDQTGLLMPIMITD